MGFRSSHDSTDSAPRTGRRAVAALFVLVAASVAVPGSSFCETSLDLATLMQKMGSSTGVIAEFVETKEIALLSAPLESRGTIYFAPPSKLLRITTSPSVTRMLMTPAAMRFVDEAGSDGFDLESNPIARQFVENFIVLFSGDLEGLRERYEVSFEADGKKWRLGLEPRRAPFDRLVDHLVLVGDGPQMESMEMVEEDGDRTVTRFTKTDTAHEFADGEFQRLFDGAPD